MPIEKIHSLHHVSKQRVRDLGEVFTPEKCVTKMLHLVPKALWQDEGVIFFEPTCGTGNFVTAIAQKRLEHLFLKAKTSGSPKPCYYAIAHTINSLWAIDVDKNNIKTCQKRTWQLVHDFCHAHPSPKKSTTKERAHFWAHVLCCIKWQIHQNEFFYALKKAPSATIKCSFANVLARPLNFKNSWAAHFKKLQAQNIVSLDFEKALKHINKARSQKESNKNGSLLQAL